MKTVRVTRAARSVRKLTVAFGTILLALAAADGWAQAPPRDTVDARFPAELDRYISRAVAEWELPGVAIAIVRNDSTLVAKGYGVRELGKPDPVDENTVFDIASLAKSFTSTAAAMLVDRGVLTWDDPVRRHLSELVLPDSQLTRSMTLRDFLSHRTGLDPANMMWVLTAVDRREVLRRARYLRVRIPPRQAMTYSNVGYTIAGEAMARAAHTSFEVLLRDLVIRPLGLSSTTWSYDQAGHMRNVASSHATIAGRQRPIRRETQRDATAPAGAVQSTAHDLARWMRFHLNGGVLDGVRHVSDSALRETHVVQVPIPTTAAMRAARGVQDSAAVGYCMGWQVMDYKGHPVRWHTGNGDGQIAYMALLPQERLGVVVMVNTWSAPLVHGALVSRILDAYLGYEPRDWVGEAHERATRAASARDSIIREEEGRRTNGPPPLPLAAYAGHYENPLFGPILVRVQKSGLTFQMGRGQTADLVYEKNENAFRLRWRDLLFRENFGSLVYFEGSARSIEKFRTTLNRDEFTATRRR